MGIPCEEMYQFREWSARLVRTIDFTRTRGTLANGNETIPEEQFFFKSLIAERKHHPENDVISLLVEEKGAEGKLTEDELLATLILSVITGHETTVNLIGNSILAFIGPHRTMRHVKGKAGADRNRSRGVSPV